MAFDDDVVNGLSVLFCPVNSAIDRIHYLSIPDNTSKLSDNIKPKKKWNKIFQQKNKTNIIHRIKWQRNCELNAFLIFYFWKKKLIKKLTKRQIRKRKKQIKQ